MKNGERDRLLSFLILQTIYPSSAVRSQIGTFGVTSNWVKKVMLITVLVSFLVSLRFRVCLIFSGLGDQ